MFGVGPGALVHDAVKIGIAPAEQRPMMDASLQAIIDLLDGKTVSVENKWFKLDNAVLQLRSYTQPRIEMVVATAITPSGALAAGKHGIGMLSIGGTSPEALKRHAANWTTYADQAQAHGHVPDKKSWRMVGMFHIAETREKALENIQFGLKSYGDYYRDVANFPIIPPGQEDDLLKYLTQSGAACIGTPDDAIRYIQAMVDATGGIGLIAELAHNWADWPATLRHHELMARYVHPHFQNSRAPMVESYELGRRNQKRFQQEATAARQLVIDKHVATATPVGAATMARKTPFILGIGGTLRDASSSERLLGVALAAAERAGARIEQISGQQLVMPMYDPAVGQRSAEAEALVRKVAEADGLILASPGYHGSISGLIKNALDYIEDLRETAPAYLDGRAVGCIACGAGWQAGAATLTTLRSIVHSLRGWPTPLGAVVNTAVTKFGPDGELGDAGIKLQLEMIGRQVVEFAAMRESYGATAPLQRLAG